jgi:predicted ArsR family transcriptional regulator
MTDRRQQILDTLRSSDSPMSIAGMGRRLGLHPNTVRFHLRLLVASGRVERVEPTRHLPGRPPLMFRAHRGMDPAGPRNYRLLADALATRMEAEAEPTAEAVAAGRAWGSRLVETTSEEQVTDDEQATDRLVRILDDLGFSPQRRRSAGESQIALRHCPFLDLVPNHQGVVCPVHLGLMQGAMTALGARTTVRSLEPFVEPDLCLAHVGPRVVAS